MRQRKPYAHLDGDSAHYPFAARRFLRKRQRRTARWLRVLGCLLVGLALAVAVRQTVFRGGQPAPPAQPSAPSGPASTGESAAAPVAVTVADGTVLPQYRALYAENREMAGWLCVPGTNIDYPVMQTPGDNEKYLRLGFDEAYSLSGSLFLDERCKLGAGATANWLIYGHNMADGSMFGQLTRYAEADFCAANPEFRFDTLTQAGTFRVVAAFYATLGEDSLPYYTFFDAADEAAWQRRYDAITAKALYDTGRTAQYGDQLLTLSTCGTTDFQTNERFAVLAVRLD